MGELSKVFTGGIVVGDGSRFLRSKISQVDSVIAHGDLSRPAVLPSGEPYSFVAGCFGDTLRSLVSLILPIRADPQVGTPIVQPVMIDVVCPHTAVGHTHNKAVHPHRCIPTIG